MVSKHKILFVATACASLTLASAGPALGAYDASDPEPLRQGQVVRLQDVATTQNVREQPVVAVGWRSGSSPGSLFMSYSLDGGATYLRGNGKFRQWAVAGEGRLGLTLDVCGDAVWAGSAAHFPGDKKNDTDVLLTRRAIGGSAAQAFVTAPSTGRKVRDVSVKCVGNKLLAIAWLEKSAGKTKARLMLRDLKSLAPAATNKNFLLGRAVYGGGISVAATAKSVHVAWTTGKLRNVRYKRFIVGRQGNPSVSPRPALKLASGNANKPQLAIQGRKVIVAYTDQGKAIMRISKNQGADFAAAQTLIGAGSVKQPSRVHSVDIFGQRIVMEGTKNLSGTTTAQRHESTDLGESWDVRSFGHNGNRVGALRKTGPGASSLVEAWLDNGPTTDTLRATYETP